jgi:homoserine dehydrogenase
MLPTSAMLANVDGVFNAVQVDGDLVGRILFYGRGAGAGPTSSAVVADVIDLAQRLPGEGSGRAPAVAQDSRPIKPLGEVRCRYYMRIIASDRPGVIAAIAGIFGDSQISLASIIQKEDVPASGPEGSNGDTNAEIVFMTHEASEAGMQAARDRITELPAVARIGSVIRVED